MIDCYLSVTNRLMKLGYFMDLLCVHWKCDQIWCVKNIQTVMLIFNSLFLGHFHFNLAILTAIDKLLASFWWLIDLYSWQNKGKSGEKVGFLTQICLISIVHVCWMGFKSDIGKVILKPWFESDFSHSRTTFDLCWNPPDCTLDPTLGLMIVGCLEDFGANTLHCSIHFLYSTIPLGSKTGPEYNIITTILDIIHGVLRDQGSTFSLPNIPLAIVAKQVNFCFKRHKTLIHTAAILS